MKQRIKIIILPIAALAIAVSFNLFDFYKTSDLGADMLNSNVGAPPSIKVGDEIISFTNTDELEGESIIIRSDQEFYEGVSGADAYFSITNIGKQAEKTIILFYFPDISIPKNFDGSEVETPTISSLQKRVGEEWRPITFFANNIRLDEKEIATALAKRKSIPSDLKIKVGAQVDIASGETIYFKSRLSYPKGNEGEFWIEALGDKGGYGLLDPKYGTKASADAKPGWYSNSWSYRRKITFVSKKVSGGSDLSNFPALVSFTDGNLKTTANGGKAASGSGEFVFTSSNGTTALDYEIETYSATTGQFIGWVEIPTLSATQDTSIYIYYGGPAAGGATNQNKTGTWDTNYKGVWHLPNGATLTSNDSTSNANNGTLINTPTATTGQIDGAGSFAAASSEYVSVANAASLRPTNITMEAWVNSNGSQGAFSTMLSHFSPGSGDFAYKLDTQSTGTKWRAYVSYGGGANFAIAADSATFSNDTWYHLAGTYDGTTMILYKNGVSAASGAGGGNINTDQNQIVTIGAAKTTTAAANFFQGIIDEIRVSNIARSAGWIVTEHNNQSRPSVFYALGGQEAKTLTNPGLRYGTKASTDTAPGWYSSASNTWTYRRKITINRFKVSGGSDLSNFPVLISFTDGNLKTTANGGKAASGSGEFVFTSSNGTTALDYEIETYSATTGQFIGWVEIPTLSATQDTSIYIYYGGPAAGGATNQNPIGVWDSNYVGIWHLPNGTTLAARDSTSNGNNGTVTNATATGGKIDGGADFNGTTALISTSDIAAMDSLSSISISGWVRADSTAGNKSITGKWDGSLGHLFQTGAAGYGDGDDIAFGMDGNKFVYTTGNFISTGTWIHIVAVFDDSLPGTTNNEYRIYINGISRALTSFAANPDDINSTGASTATFEIGRLNSGTGRYWDGVLDEIRVSNIARSAGWIVTEHNNQSRPSVFYALGGQEAKTLTNPGLKFR